MRFFQNTVAALLLIAFACNVLAQPPDSSALREKVQMTISTWAGFGPAFIAKEKGFFGPLDVQIRVTDDFKTLYALAQGQGSDIVVGTVDMVVMLGAQRAPGKAFLVTDQSNGADGLLTVPSITSVEQLKGKRIAYTTGSPSHVLLAEILKGAALTFSDIQSQQVDDPSQAAQVLLSGSVDAAVTWEPFIGQISKEGKAIALKTSRDYPDLIVDTLWGSNKFLARPSMVARVAEGWLRAVAFAQQFPDEAATIMAKGFGIKPDEIRVGVAGLRWGTPAMNRAFLTQIDPKAPKLFDRIGQLFVEQKILSNPPPPGREYFTDMAGSVFDRMTPLLESNKR